MRVKDDWKFIVTPDSTRPFATRYPSDYKDVREVPLEDPLVTPEVIVDAWQQVLEGENYHSMMDIPENLVKILRWVDLPEEKVKEALWEILTTQGGWV